MTIDVPVFRHTDHGVELVNDWPSETVITRELLEQADPRLLKRRGRSITFAPGHETATYRITRRGPYPRTYWLVRQ